MKRDDAFELATQWRDNPELLVGDLRAACRLVDTEQLLNRPTSSPKQQVRRVMDAALVPEATRTH